MKRAVLYARVSSDLQRKEGTVESQVLELRKHIIAAGDVLIKEYIDDGYGGARLDRPALTEFRADLKTNLFDVVYFLAADRIAREVTLQTIIIEEILKNRKQLVINTKDYIKNPENKFTLTILSAVAELERAKIIERVGRGKALKLAKGHHTGRGWNLFGYDYVHKRPDTEAPTLKINDREAAIVKSIFESYVNNKGGIRSVVHMLEDKGHLTKTGKKLWRNGIIKGMLRNHAYIGTMYFNKMETIKEYANPIYGITKTSTKLKPRDKSLWVGVKVPAIVSKEIFDKAQEKLEFNRKKYRNPRIPQLLSNLIRCGGCGGSFYSYRRYYIDNRVQPNRVYHRASYKCNWTIRRYMHSKNSQLRQCDNNEIKTSILEEKVFRLIEEHITKSEALKKHMDIFKSEGRTAQLKLQRQLRKIDTQLKKTGIAKKRLLELYVSGGAEQTEYAKRSTEYDHELENLTTEKVELIKRIPLLHNKEVLDMSIAQYCDEINLRLVQCKDFQTKRDFLLKYIDHVVLYKNLVELHGFVPVKTEKNGEEEAETAKIGYKIMAEIAWAERMAKYWKRDHNGSRISVMDFNNHIGESGRKMKDVPLFSQGISAKTNE